MKNNNKRINEKPKLGQKQCQPSGAGKLVAGTPKKKNQNKIKKMAKEKTTRTRLAAKSNWRLHLDWMSKSLAIMSWLHDSNCGKLCACGLV